MTQDGMQIRERIISFIRLRGPSLPVQIAKETGLSILFASAFLSEIFGEKIVKISNIRIGSSPLYFMTGQEPQLERFSQYLKSKEKEAFLLLKEMKILRDSEQQPAIRVALREIKDFAIPFEKNNEVFWRYFLVEEPNEIRQSINEMVNESLQEKKENIIEEIEVKPEINNPKKEGIVKEKSIKKPKQETKPKKTNKADKKDENFFNKIKDFLAKKKIEIIDIKDFQNDEAILKVKKGNNEELLFVFNKKVISEKELLKANKKATEIKLSYSVLFLGEPSKKLSELVSAIKNLSNIDRLE
ncbi:MAG: hypothetical protein AABW47_03200 [Nanoarchaeota archaeon]